MTLRVLKKVASRPCSCKKGKVESGSVLAGVPAKVMTGAAKTVLLLDAAGAGNVMVTKNESWVKQQFFFIKF